MKIESITAKNWLGKGNLELTFNSEDNIEIITGPNMYGKTLLLSYMFDLCAGYRSPYRTSHTHFDSMSVKYDTGEERGYSYPGTDANANHIECSWDGSVEEMPVCYMICDHCDIKENISVPDELIEKFNNIVADSNLHIGDFKFIRDRNRIQFTYNGERINESTKFSSGQIQMIRLVTSLMKMHTSGHKIMFIDDIEMNIHVAILHNLYNIIKDLKPEDSQIIVTTHSAAFINSRWTQCRDLYYSIFNKPNDK